MKGGCRNVDPPDQTGGGDGAGPDQMGGLDQTGWGGGMGPDQTRCGGDGAGPDQMGGVVGVSGCGRENNIFYLICFVFGDHLGTI